MPAGAIEPGDLDLGAEFEGLVERATDQRLTGNAGLKAEIVFDARRGAGLSNDCALVEHNDRQALGGAINGGSEPAGPAPTTATS